MASSGLFDVDSSIETRACVIQEGSVALVPVGIRLGDSPHIFLTFLNHFSGDGASPLEQLRGRK